MELNKILKLNIFTDETLTEIKRTVEVDKIKIPWRTANCIIKSLDMLTDGTEEEILKFISNNTELIDKIIKATFGVTESEMDCIDGMELIQLGVALYKRVIEKMESIKQEKKAAATM